MKVEELNTVLNNANQMEYKELLIAFLNESLKDEISAVVSYNKLSNFAKGETSTQLRGELVEHADEEYGHFKEILAFAGNHGLENSLVFSFDMKVIEVTYESNSDIALFNQKLEKEAYTKYKRMSEIARQNNDMETMEFFRELMVDEMGHFDDMAVLTGASRPLNESTRLGKMLAEYK